MIVQLEYYDGDGRLVGLSTYVPRLESLKEKMDKYRILPDNVVLFTIDHTERDTKVLHELYKGITSEPN
mgnify:CR=1 FL=1